MILQMELLNTLASCLYLPRIKPLVQLTLDTSTVLISQSSKSLATAWAIRVRFITETGAPPTVLINDFYNLRTVLLLGYRRFGETYWRGLKGSRNVGDRSPNQAA